MKNLTIVLTSVILALGLSSAAFANEPIEIAIAGEDGDGNKLNIVATGDAFDQDFDGTIKLTCKRDPEDDTDTEIEVGSVVNFGLDGLAIDYLAGGDFGFVLIDLDDDPNTMRTVGAPITNDCDFNSNVCPKCKINGTLKIE